MLPVGFDSVHCWVGLNWLVAWEVPVNTMYQGRMLSYMLENSRARVAVMGERYLDRLAAAVPQTGQIVTVVVPDATGPLPKLPFRMITGDEFLAGAEPRDDHDGPQPWDVTEIFYTSGTTGPSKGVLFSHKQLHASTEAITEDYAPDDCFYGPFPMYHVSGKNFVYATLLADMRLVVREQFKTDEFWGDIKRYGCTATLLLGAMANFVYRQPVHPDEVDSPLNKVLMVPLIPELQEFKERFGCRVSTVFNMTEISSPIVGRFGDTDDMPVTACGKIRNGYECRVVDEHDREVATGELGELIVRADEPWRLNSGYFNMPDKTAEAWRNG
jgi:crotonobetaine/carnitine-CoA ligase